MSDRSAATFGSTPVQQNKDSARTWRMLQIATIFRAPTSTHPFRADHNKTTTSADVNPRAISIADELRRHSMHDRASLNVTIFLCGGAAHQEALLRRTVGNALSNLRSKYRYKVFYPEDMFVELVLGHDRQDLLTLENLLATSVGSIVILLQSPGTFSELGAFANHNELKNKLVVVVDEKYRKSQSFINTGPLRYLQRMTDSRVIYELMDETNIESIVRLVSEATREISQKHPPSRDLTNPILCYEVYLRFLYVFDPLPRKALLQIAKVLQMDKPQLAMTAAETVMNGLVNNGDALLVAGHLRISEQGVKKLFAAAGTERREKELRGMLSKLRTQALNHTLRHRHNRFWEEAA